MNECQDFDVEVMNCKAMGAIKSYIVNLTRKDLLGVSNYKIHLFYLQAFTEEIQYKQAELDHVNEKAQSLLQTNADAKTSHAITQLTTRYQGVIALSKVFY